MSGHLGFLALLAALLSVSAGSAAQQAEPAPDSGVPPAMVMPENARLQAARQSLAQSRFNTLAALQTQDVARPDAPRVVPVNWVAAREDARTQTQSSELTNVAAARQVAQFPRPTNAEAAGVTNTRLPVLIPSAPALELAGETTVLLFPRENFYTLSITGEDILIEVFGTRLAHAQAPNALAARQLRAADAEGYRFSQTEFGREVSFNRYGAAYSVTIECDAPEADPRCADDEYARRVVRSLLIAAGSPDEGGQ